MNFNQFLLFLGTWNFFHAAGTWNHHDFLSLSLALIQFLWARNKKNIKSEIIRIIELSKAFDRIFFFWKHVFVLNFRNSKKHEAKTTEFSLTALQF